MDNRDSQYWKNLGMVENPKTGRLNRLGGQGAHEAIKLLLKRNPNSKIHWKHIKFMAKRGGVWGKKMEKLLKKKELRSK